MTTCLFLPFGRGQLKEAIGMQLFSFFCFFIMMAVFHFELYERGLNYELPVIGEDVWQVRNRQMDTQTDRHTDRQTDRQTDR